MASARLRAGNVLGANPLTRRALDPTNLGPEEALGRAQVQVSPATDRAAVVHRGLKAAMTLVAPLSSTDLHHHPFGGEGHPLDNDTVDGDDAIKCSRGAHVVPLGFGCLNASETTRTTCALSVIT